MGGKALGADREIVEGQSRREELVAGQDTAPTESESVQSTAKDSLLISPGGDEQNSAGRSNSKKSGARSAKSAGLLHKYSESLENWDDVLQCLENPGPLQNNGSLEISQHSLGTSLGNEDTQSSFKSSDDEDCKADGVGEEYLNAFTVSRETLKEWSTSAQEHNEKFAWISAGKESRASPQKGIREVVASWGKKSAP
ncbi:hypothetical protein NDN08_005619 [Rhodosorus marinus]|uniref:Uncharacterized protein n=1 Tax=Rhodosorus marinus TaxID=101924 RepID=A0AAV8V4L5_9RHOD|nr:hypothetical protein NDN08_005619 [Rhodosorus marinus]